MPQPPYQFGDVAQAVEATIVRHPRLNWHAADPSTLPNGRYLVDHATSLIYLSTHLSGAEFFAALLRALDELHEGAVSAVRSTADLTNIVAFPRCRRSIGGRGRPRRGRTG